MENESKSANTDNKSEDKHKIIRFERGFIVMERRIILWIVIGILFLAVLFLTFKVGAGGSVTSTANAAASAAKSAASSGMVGGC